jgi:hypothetical protein
MIGPFCQHGAFPEQDDYGCGLCRQEAASLAAIAEALPEAAAAMRDFAASMARVNEALSGPVGESLRRLANAADQTDFGTSGRGR